MTHTYKGIKLGVESAKVSSVHKEVKLGADSISYIRDRLENGITLSRILLQRSDLEEGEVVTFLPSDIEVDSEALKRFGAGGKALGNVDSYLTVRTQEFLNAGESRVCLFEDALLSSTAPFLSSPLMEGIRVLFYESEVYYLLTKEDVESDIVPKTITKAKSWLFTAIMTHTLKDDSFSLESKTISLTELEVLAARAEKIIIGAYDGEGYLIWSKP